MLARAESAIARRASEQAEQMARARQIAPASPQTPAPAHASPPRPKLSDREAEEFYQRGLQAQSAQRSDEAVRYWELVWAARPDYREVASNLKREYLARGMELFASGRLDDAMVEWQRVLRVDPTDARARGYLARAEAQRARSREILGPQR
jgi:tetratricopeptide (TPR) repeat protein